MREILTWPGFDVELMTGPNGLDRPIRVAHATELVDPSRFLRGDELIMTVGSELRGAADCRRFVANLVRSRAAGIALAIGVEGHHPPKDLAPAAEKMGLSLITVPPTLPFVQFIEKFQELADKRHEYERLRREDGRMLDYIRRGYASPQIFRERFPEMRGAQYCAVCVPADTDIELDGVIIEGWLDDRTVFIADELFVRDFTERSTLSVFGVGSPVSLASLARTLKEAAATLALSSRRGEGAGPRDLSTLSGLVERLSAEQFAPFQDHVVQPLLEYDARHGRGLWPTLVAYFTSDASISETAERLGIHANSVRYRLSRVTELTGLDPHSLDGQFALLLAVRGSQSKR